MIDPYDDERRDEFQWEKEIRKDDERVNAYLNELPRYIDLPDEDKVIDKRMRRRGEFFPPSSGDGFDDLGDDDQDIPESDFLSHRDGADLYACASKLALELCEMFAVEQSLESARAMMRAMALLGKIMARSTDILRLNDGELVPFRIALCKRFLADINELVGVFGALDPPPTEQQTTEVFSMRDQVLSMLRGYRGGKRS